MGHEVDPYIDLYEIGNSSLMMIFYYYYIFIFLYFLDLFVSFSGGVYK